MTSKGSIDLFDLHSENIYQYSLDDQTTICIEKIGMELVRISFQDKEYNDQEPPYGCNIYNVTHNSLVSPIPDTIFFIISSKSTYAISFNKAILLEISNNRLWELI